MSNGKVCGIAVFSLIYTILTISIVYFGLLAFYENQEHGYSQRFYSFLGEALVFAVILTLACIKSRITYIILMIIYGILALYAIFELITLILVLTGEKPKNHEQFRSTVIILVLSVVYMFIRVFMFKLFFVGYQVISR